MASYVEEEVWKCAKHPSKRRRNGICPACLRERLVGLCPRCATVRPCACLDGVSSFHRSRSLAIPFLRSRNGGEEAPSSDFLLKKTPSFMSILRRAKRFDPEVEGKGDFDRRNRIDDFARMVTRSRSVSAGTGKFWHFPSPMTVFRSPKAPKVVVQDRSR